MLFDQPIPRLRQAVLVVQDRHNDHRITYVCANDADALVKPGEPFPLGAELVFESWAVRHDASGSLMRDASGNPLPERLTSIHVLRKNLASAAAIRQRPGQWECLFYRRDDSPDSVLHGPFRVV